MDLNDDWQLRPQSNAATGHRSASSVEVGDQFSVGGSRGVQFVVAFLKLAAQVDDLLFEVGDPALELVDVGGSAEAGCAPGVLAEQFGQLGLQLPDPGGLPGELALGVGQVCLEGCPSPPTRANVAGPGIVFWLARG